MKDFFATLMKAFSAVQILAQNIDKIKALLSAYEDIQNQLHANREELHKIVANVQGIRDAIRGDSEALAGLKTQLDNLLTRLSSIIPGWR